MIVPPLEQEGAYRRAIFFVRLRASSGEPKSSHRRRGSLRSIIRTPPPFLRPARHDVVGDSQEQVTRRLQDLHRMRTAWQHLLYLGSWRCHRALRALDTTRLRRSTSYTLRSRSRALLFDSASWTHNSTCSRGRRTRSRAAVDARGSPGENSAPRVRRTRKIRDGRPARRLVWQLLSIRG
jgi:hypothetical protein